jgi:biopolymer transport protein ExbB/TolQ
MRLVILSQGVEIIIQTALAITALMSAFVALRSYKRTQNNEIAKQKDLDKIDEKVMDHDKRIGYIEKHNPLKDYVDQQDRATHHRIDTIEKRMDENLKELNNDVKKILTILIDKKQ